MRRFMQHQNDGGNEIKTKQLAISEYIEDSNAGSKFV